MPTSLPLLRPYALAAAQERAQLLIWLRQRLPLAEQIIQDQRWDLPTAPALLPALAPSGGPIPGSATAARSLPWLNPLRSKPAQE